VEISRLPGIRKINRYDVVVFNDPYYRSADSISMDIKRYYVKRCIALPGDTFEIRKGINKVRGVEETLGKIERQRMLPLPSCRPKDGKKRESSPWTPY
jgi:signal peptidase I